LIVVEARSLVDRALELELELLIHHPGSTAYRYSTGKYNLEAKSRVYRLRKDIDCRMKNQNQDPGLKIKDQGS